MMGTVRSLMYLVLTPCRLQSGYRHFRETCCFHFLQWRIRSRFDSEVWCGTIPWTLKKVAVCSNINAENNTASKPRRPDIETSPSNSSVWTVRP